MKAIHISLLFFASALILFAIHLCSQPYINNNGILVEPAFFCLPLGLLSLLPPLDSDLLPFLNDRNNKSDYKIYVKETVKKNISPFLIPNKYFP